jgi:hypothetical protein
MLVAAKTVWIGGSKIEHAMTKPIRIQRQRIKRAGRCHPTLSMAATRQIGEILGKSA